MTLKQSLREARAIFERHHISDSRLVSELLLRHALGISRVQLYQELHRELGPGEEADFGRLIERCLSGEPVAYITGHREFYGLDFYVDANVLVPRPETELLVERALALARERPIATIADIGTGSGAVAVSLALGLPQTRIYATDVSAPALRVARFNCRKHGVEDRVCLLRGDLLSPLPEPVDLIVANLPYVGEEEVSRRGLAGFEPALALNGGGDGLEKIRELCSGLGEGLCPGGTLLLEVGMGQSRTVAGLLHSLFPEAGIEITPDLSGIERVVGLTPGLTPVCPDARLFS
ncbi:MAG TPA: peptide chain release factor N(5)-glutamine methyltransferase [Dehalococcoidia bacterium]|nr:peptide chain release factor N(5)-glutamine methyltransferase [Dehalococcoidia bacterium]